MIETSNSGPREWTAGFVLRMLSWRAPISTRPNDNKVKFAYKADFKDLTFFNGSGKYGFKQYLLSDVKIDISCVSRSMFDGGQEPQEIFISASDFKAYMCFSRKAIQIKEFPPSYTGREYEYITPPGEYFKPQDIIIDHEFSFTGNQTIYRNKLMLITLMK